MLNLQSRLLVMYLIAAGCPAAHCRANRTTIMRKRHKTSAVSSCGQLEQLDGDAVCRKLLSTEGCPAQKRWVFHAAKQLAVCRTDPCPGAAILQGNKCRDRGHCRQGMRLYEDAQGLGYCDCLPSYIYVRQADRCYHAHTEGPCRKHQLLILRNNQPRCVYPDRDRACSDGQLWWSGSKQLSRGCHPLCRQGQRVCAGAHLSVNASSLQLQPARRQGDPVVTSRLVRGPVAGGWLSQMGSRKSIRRDQKSRRQLWRTPLSRFIFSLQTWLQKLDSTTDATKS